MKKTQVIYLFRTIRKGLVSFLAVAMMAATAIAIYLGDQSAAKAILDAANRYFIENRLHNLEVSSPYGITQEDIKAISQWDGVDSVEGGFSSIVLADTGHGTGKTQVEVHALLSTMNLPVIVEGTLPSGKNEAAVEQIMADKEGISVGDRITIEHDGQLRSSTFTVTAIINQPSYCYARGQDTRGQSEIGIGSAYYYMVLPKAAFDPSYFSGGYSTAYIKNYDLDRYHYSSEKYKQREDAFMNQIRELGTERALLRYEAVKDAIPEQLERARVELRRQEKNLADGRTMLTTVLQMLGLPGELEVAQKLLADNERYQELVQQAISGFAAGEQALAEGWAALKQAEETAQELPFYDWIISGRNDIGDVRSIRIAVEGLYGLSYSMAIIFVIVAITVCYAAISRMISESSNLMGMQKALGFTTREIRNHFMLYSLLCGLWGALEGWVCGYAFVQTMNLRIYQTLFLMGDVPLAFAWDAALLVALFFVTIFLLSAWAACAKKVKLSATELLRGETAQRDRTFWFENWKAYQKLSLYTKTMIKNVVVDKSRMLTTVMGVAGCATLLVISFTLLLAVQDSGSIQFENYFLYENRLVIDRRKTDGREFTETLEAQGIANIRIMDKLKFCRESGGEWSGAHVVAVSDGAALKDFMVLEDPYTKRILEIPDSGALVSLRCAETFGLEIGSKFEVLGPDGQPRTVPVSGIVEHYLGYNLIVMSDESYEMIFGQPADECVFLLNGNIDGLYDLVKDLDGFLSLRDNSEYAGIGDVMNIIVIICFIFAALMAVLVMLNQNVMHINQKATELSVMRINGFTLRETKNFVSKDTFFLTVLGVLAGWVLGVVLGHQVLLILEVGVTHYVRTPSLPACLIAAGICGSFAYAMNKIAVRRIHTLNLTNVNAN